MQTISFEFNFICKTILWTRVFRYEINYFAVETTKIQNITSGVWQQSSAGPDIIKRR